MNLWRQRIKRFSSKSDFRAWEKQMLTHKRKKKKKGRNYKDKVHSRFKNNTDCLNYTIALFGR